MTEEQNEQSKGCLQNIAPCPAGSAPGDSRMHFLVGLHLILICWDLSFFNCCSYIALWVKQCNYKDSKLSKVKNDFALIFHHKSFKPCLNDTKLPKLLYKYFLRNYLGILCIYLQKTWTASPINSTMHWISFDICCLYLVPFVFLFVMWTLKEQTHGRTKPGQRLCNEKSILSTT